MRYLAILLSLALSAACPVAAQDCVGDCDEDDRVSVEEILLGVSIALGQRSRFDCFEFDANFDGRISINELVAAVDDAFGECQSFCRKVSDPVLGDALGYLSCGDVGSANSELAQAVAQHPDDPRANLYYAMTRVAVPLFEDARIQGLLSRAGVTIEGGVSDVCRIELETENEYPAGAPRSGEMIIAFRDVLQPAIGAALENLSRLPPSSAIRFDLDDLPTCLRPSTDTREIEIDRADVVALEGLLRLLTALLDLFATYDLDVDTNLAADATHQQIVQAHPNLLALQSAALLSSVREQVETILELTGTLLESARNETDPQSDDVLVISPDDEEEVIEIEQVIALVRQSLRGEVTIPADFGLSAPERLNLRPLFDGSFASLRQFLPAVNARGRLDPGRFPDPTFGGMTPDLTQQDIDDILAGESDDFGSGR